MPTVEVYDEENAPLLKGGNKIDTEGPFDLSVTEMLVQSRWDGLPYFRALATLYLVSMFVWDFIFNMMNDPEAFFLQLADWDQVLAIIYFGYSTCYCFQYFGFGTVSSERSDSNVSDSSYSTWFSSDWEASLARLSFEISWSISVVVMLIFWITQFHDEDLTGTGAELILNIHSHFVVFVLLIFDLVFNRVVFKMSHSFYLVLLLLVYGVADGVYLFSTDVSKTDTFVAYVLVVAFCFLSFLVGMALTHFRDTRDAHNAEEENAQWKVVA